MANSDAPRGMVPVNSLGQAYCGRVRMYYKDGGDSVEIFVGDAVTTTGTAHTDEFSTPIIEQADANNPILGVMVGKLHVNPDSLDKIYSPGSTGEYIFITDDPNQLYEIQEDSDGGALTIVDTGQNIDLIVPSVTSRSLATGLSSMEINSDGAKGTATAQLRLIQISPRIGNALGTNAKWLVKINESELGGVVGL